MIKYDKLFKLLDKKHISVTALINAGFHRNTIYKLKRGESVTVDTIDKLCELLNVQPGAILEYVADDPQPEPAPES